ncbi:hypothetical protein ACDQ55_10775 [Chitinophaga sp. 30R24]|uniref:hypothetical protein n=1 Tax=Chitinophaga sp. 30R24 TaxID=3248838 RepID=UPI003B8F6CEB
MIKIGLAKWLLLATGYMMLHWPCANATIRFGRQGIDFEDGTTTSKMIIKQ